MWLRVANISQVGAGSLLETPERPELLATLFYTFSRSFCSPSGGSAGKRPRDEEAWKKPKKVWDEEKVIMASFQKETSTGGPPSGAVVKDPAASTDTSSGSSSSGSGSSSGVVTNSQAQFTLYGLQETELQETVLEFWEK